MNGMEFSHLFAPQNWRINLSFYFFRLAHKENLTWAVLVNIFRSFLWLRNQLNDPHINLPRIYMLFFSVFFFFSFFLFFCNICFHFFALALLRLRYCLHFITVRANKTCHLPIAFPFPLPFPVSIPTPELSTRIKLTKLFQRHLGQRGGVACRDRGWCFVVQSWIVNKIMPAFCIRERDFVCVLGKGNGNGKKNPKLKS